MSQFSRENLFSQSTEKFRRGTLLCSTKNIVSKRIIYKSERGREGGREAEKEGRRLGGKEGGREGLSRFSVKTFCLPLPKVFYRTPSVFNKKSGIEKILAKREEASITIFRRIVLSHSTESSRRGTHLCFRMFPVSKNIRLKGGK